MNAPSEDFERRATELIELAASVGLTIEHKDVFDGRSWPSNFCFTCRKVVGRCWGNGMCSGGGHCDECLGYDFTPTRGDE